MSINSVYLYLVYHIGNYVEIHKLKDKMVKMSCRAMVLDNF